MAMAFARRYPDRVDHLVLSQVASVQEMHMFVRRLDVRIAGLSMFSTPAIGQAFIALKQAYVAHGWFKIALPNAARPIRSGTSQSRPMTQGARSVCHRSFRASRA
jgi:hypothetical protein